MPINIIERAITPYNEPTSRLIQRERYNLFVPIAGLNKIGMAGFSPKHFTVKNGIVEFNGDVSGGILNIEPGTGGNSAQFHTCSAIANFSLATGYCTQAGSKAFTVLGIDAIAKSYRLDSVEGLDVNDVYSIYLKNTSSSEQAENVGKIIRIDVPNNTVYVDTFKNVPENTSFVERFDAISDDGIDGEVNTFRIIEKPNVGTRTIGCMAHATGQYAYALSKGAEASGAFSVAHGSWSHAEGYGTKAAYCSHAEGKNTNASGQFAHAEGTNTEAAANASHAEGYGTKATQPRAHAEGNLSEASGYASHAEGNDTHAQGDTSHTEGDGTIANGRRSHAEGYKTVAVSDNSHAEGVNTVAKGGSSHIEGGSSIQAAYQNDNSVISNAWENSKNFAAVTGEYSHVEGWDNFVSGKSAHAEGRQNFVTGARGHAEGYMCEATADDAHAEGSKTKAANQSAHSEGEGTVAAGRHSHAQGRNTQANGNRSFAAGDGTIANGDSQTVIGKYNSNNNNALFIVGNGKSDNASDRSNAFEVISENGIVYLKVGNTKISEAKFQRLINLVAD